jgi:hypothetical protein
MGGAGTWWQRGNVEGACVCRRHLFAIREIGTMDLEVGRMLVAGKLVVRKWPVAPESRMAHPLMVS